MNEPLSIGILGAGVFGGYHAQKCVDDPRIRLSGVCDIDMARARMLAARHDVRALAQADLLAASDAIIIASSAVSHGEAALAAIRAGCHVLVEKPIAHTVAMAETIVRTAEQADVVLQVGHQERFVVAATGLHEVPERPYEIHARRGSKPGLRGQDVSVTLDLMTHDIDLVLWLLDRDPEQVSGETQLIHGHHADAALGLLDFRGTRVRLEASRADEVSQRVMQLTYPSGKVEIDFNARTLTHDTPFELNADFADDPDAADSLAAGTRAFVAAILDGAPVPITGGHGLRALRIAVAVDGKGTKA